MAYSKQTWDATSYVTPTRMNHIEDGIKAVEDGSVHLLFSDTWDYAEKTFTVTTSSSFLIYGARGTRGVFAMLPVNAEVCEAYNTFGFTITHATSDNVNHTITFSAAANPYGTSCTIYVVGF